MNLKEAFRYQLFLKNIMNMASMSLQQRDHCLITTKTHKKSKANSEVEDVTEVVETPEEYYKNDDVIALMIFIVDEREKLTTAISKAKSEIEFDVDAAVETNKFRQLLAGSIKNMMRMTPSKRTETGRDYKFNVEGNQTPYVYEIDVVTEDNYDRNAAKKVMRDAISKSDEVSAKIDAAMINTVVDYEPKYDVNESFEDIMSEFVANNS